MNSLSLLNLQGKTALITGSGSGIGFALAQGLAGAGTKIILNGRNEAKLEEAKNKIKKMGHAVNSLIFDVGNSREVKKPSLIMKKILVQLIY